MNRDPVNKNAPALERGIAILDLVATSKDKLTVSQISRALGIAKSSTHELCVTLVNLELLIRNTDQSFRLGPHIMRWSGAFARRSDVVAEFASIWDSGTQMPGATITLSVLEGAEVVYLAARNSGASVSLLNFRVGMRLPAAFTATGKSFLSYMSDRQVLQLYADEFPEPMTANSVSSIDELLQELAIIRERGYSVDNQQIAEGVCCFGASILNSDNHPIAGIAVSLLSKKLKMEEVEEVIANVRLITKEISYRMGADI